MTSTRERLGPCACRECAHDAVRMATSPSARSRCTSTHACSPSQAAILAGVMAIAAALLSDRANAIHPGCMVQPDPGPCKAFFRRFFWNNITETCEPFIYGGCYGVVPFRTAAQCEAANCKTSGDDDKALVEYDTAEQANLNLHEQAQTGPTAKHHWTPWRWLRTWLPWPAPRIQTETAQSRRSQTRTVTFVTKTHVT